MAQDPQELLTAYLPVFKQYDLLASEVAARLRTILLDAGLRPTITHRAKDIRSLIKKCLLHDGPVDLVPDKAGVKVVVRYAAEVETVNFLIQGGYFDADPPDIKANQYKPFELGYLGTHHQVRLPNHNCPSDLKGLECEIIVHTGAENLWDSISHELIYKPFLELPANSQRSLVRLVALMELFDKEVAAVRAQYINSANYSESFMLDILEKYFFRLDPHDYQRDMSIRMLELLRPSIREEKLQRFDEVIGQFVKDNLDALHNAYRKHRQPDDLRGLFLHQPESLLMFAMFDWNQKHDVTQAWLQLYPRAYLDDLASVWGVTVPR